MSQSRVPLAVLLILQALAFLIYPLSYFQQAPQAAVMPPVLLVLFILALVGINTGTLSLFGGRSLLIFVQGIYTVVRLMTIFPNLKTPSGDWAWALLVCQFLGLALSWWAMAEMERRSLQSLKLKQA